MARKIPDKSSRPTRINFQSLSTKVTGGLILVVMAVVCALFAYQYMDGRHRGMEAFGDQSAAVGEIVRVGLENAMLRNDFRTLHEMVAKLENRPDVERILILNNKGRVAVSSDDSLAGRSLNRSGGNCVVCHRLSPEERPKSAVLHNKDGSNTFRSVTPIYNRAPCHQCHSKSDRLNGILIMDLPMASYQAAGRQSLIKMVVSEVITVIAIVLFLGLMLNRFVLARLRRFSGAIDSMGGMGRLPRVDIASNDEFGRLASSFNKMSDDQAKMVGQLRRNRVYLENLIESIQDEIIVLDNESRVVKANRAARERLGLEDVESGKLKCYELVGCEDPSNNNCCPAFDSINDGNPRRYLEKWNCNDGSMPEMEVHSFPMFGEGGRVEQIVMVARDISSRKQLEAKLAQSDRMALLGQLASGVVHEVNNPLGAITVCIDGMQSRIDEEAGPNAAQLKQYLDIMRQESYRCKAIVSNMLDFARQAPSMLDRSDLGALLDETLSIVRYHAKSAGKNIMTDIAVDIGEITTDGAKLKQVFLNLILNAMDAMEKGGALHITARREKGEEDAANSLVMDFRDEGTGIEPRVADKIFEPFYTTKPPGVGTGLGLYICGNLLAQLGGTISLASEPGKGSVFTIVLPLLEDKADNYLRPHIKDMDASPNMKSGG